MGKQIRSAFCPVCGIAHGQRKKSKARGGTGYYLRTETESYWDWLLREYPNGSEHFGVIQETGQGRGKSFSVIGYFTPQEDQDGYFAGIKRRLLQTIEAWIRQGWLNAAELNQAIGNKAITRHGKS